MDCATIVKRGYLYDKKMGLLPVATVSLWAGMRERRRERERERVRERERERGREREEGERQREGQSILPVCIVLHVLSNPATKDI